MKINVFITGAGGTTGIGVVKALNLERKKFKIIVADMNPASSGLYLTNLIDNSYCIPAVIDKNYIPILKDILEKERIDIIIPTSPPEILFFSLNEDLFSSKGIRIATPGKNIIDQFSDKWKSYQCLNRLKIPAPYSFLPENKYLSDRISYPMIVKPRFSDSSKGVRLVFSDEELSIAIKNTVNPLVQEYIHGEEFTVGTLTDLKGEIIGILPMKRELTGGSTSRAVTIENSVIEDVVNNAIKRIGIKGPANFQLRVSEKTGIPMIFEINPRFSSTTPFQAYAGFNSPVLFCLNLMGEKIEKINNFKKGLIMMRYWEEVYIEENALLGPLNITCRQIEETTGATWSDWFKKELEYKKEI